MFKKLLLFTLLVSSCLSAQSTSIGFNYSIRQGNISEPINNGGSITNLQSDWLTNQYGVALEYNLTKLSGYQLKGLNKIVYGKNSNAFNYLITGPNIFETEITSELNYLFSIDQAVMIEHKLYNNFSFDFGINLQLLFSNYHDKILDKESNYIRDYEDKSFINFNIGPVLKMNIELDNGFSLSLGLDYYLLDDEIKTTRIKSKTDVGTEYFSSKTVQKIEYFVILMYSPF